jgi:hypothetical protein
MAALDRERIRRLLAMLDAEMAKLDAKGEIFLLGGAVMCMVLNARAATEDVDAVFLPTAKLRIAAARVADGEGLPPDWLNDAAKAFLSQQGEFKPFLQLEHLTVSVATPEYLLAMKCLAMRLGAEFHDEADVRFLLRYLNVETYERALEIIRRFYPADRFPQKTLYALEEILAGP